MMRKWRLTEFMDDAIAAFAVAEEMEPGVVAINDAAVRGIHLTKLKLDGSSKADTERNKIIIAGRVGSPIVLAPVNDLLGLAIGAGLIAAGELNSFLDGRSRKITVESIFRYIRRRLKESQSGRGKARSAGSVP
jgi:hypothetical protein